MIRRAPSATKRDPKAAFHTAEALVHQASSMRGALAVRATMDVHRQAVWISGRCTAQQGHGIRHQTCLAQLAHDIARAVEVGDDPVQRRLRLRL